MVRYVLSPLAQADLEAIWDYTAETWGAVQAEAYVRQVMESIKHVASNPSLGRNCDHVRRGYRRFATGSHVVFYRLSGDLIDVVRILHQRMDFDRHL